MTEQGDRQGMGIGMTAILFTVAVGARLWQGLTSLLAAPFADGTLAAAGRQGLDELGEALKAFPESIQTQEYGSIGNPTQGEIAASRQPQNGLYGRSLSPGTPSQIAAANRYSPSVPVQNRGDHGNEQQREI